MEKYNCYFAFMLIFVITVSPATHAAFLPIQQEAKLQQSQSIEIGQVEPTINIIPTVIMADYWFYALNGENSTNLIRDLINTTSTYYQNSNIKVSFPVEAFDIDTTQTNSSSKYTYTEDVEGKISATNLLSSLQSYRQSNTQYPVDYNMVLLSGRTFQGNLVGLGYINSVGGTHHFTSVVQANGTFSDAYTAATIAHEMGHTLSAAHDESTVCSGSPGIMAAISDPNNIYTTFSSCSQTAINDFVATELNQYQDTSYPQVSMLEDQIFRQQVGGEYSIIWTISDEYLYSYQITINSLSSPIFALDQNITSISYILSLDNIASYSITVTVIDGAGRETNSSMLFDVVPLPPVLVLTPNNTTINLNEQLNLTWIVDSQASCDYILYKDSNVIINETLNSNQISYGIDKVAQVGVFNYTLVITEQYGAIISDSVIVTVNNVENTDTPNTSNTTNTLISSNNENTKDNGFNLKNLPFSSFLVIVIALISIPVLRSRRINS